MAETVLNEAFKGVLIDQSVAGPEKILVHAKLLRLTFTPEVLNGKYVSCDYAD